jgi:hypothetical protein
MEIPPDKETNRMTNAIIPNLTELTIERSSQIAAIGYDSEILFVSFRRGGLYTYDQVTPAEYDALLNSDSVGTLFAKTIKGHKPYKRVATKVVPAKAELEPTAPVASEPTKTTNLVQFDNGKRVAAMMPKEAGDLATAAQEWAMKATAIRITDVATHEAAMKILVDLDTVKKRIVETWKPMKAAAFAAHRAVCDKESELLKPLIEADRQLRAQIGDYTYEQLKAAQAEDDRNRRVAEEEARQRAIAETENNALAAAEELLAMGDEEGANAVLDAPMPAAIRYDMPMPVRPAVATVNGVGGGITYEVTITDLASVPREYLVVDVAKTVTEIQRRVKQAGGRLQIPGTSIRETFAARRVGGRR